jgi:DNA-binding transcriptional ArsR family regulator
MHWTPMMGKMDHHALDYVAEYFKALSEPTRLRLVHALQDGEKNVGELTEIAGSTQANVSKHLSILTRTGLVKRATRGTSVYYEIADPRIYELCDLVCGQIGEKLSEEMDVNALLLASMQKSA